MDKDKILIIEDNEDDYLVINRYVKSKYDTIYNDGSGDIIKIIQSQKPVCVLLDYHLGNSSGCSLLIEIVDDDTIDKIPIIILTGEKNPDVIVSCMQSGAADYIGKGNFNKEEILDKITRAVSNAQLHAKIKQQQLEIEQNEQNLRALFNAITGVVFEIDINGVYQYIAPTSPNFLIMPSEEMVGKSFYDFFEKNEADRYLKFVKKCLADKKSYSIEYKIEVEGNTYWFEGTGYPKTKNSILFLAHDISEQKKVAQSLVDTESKFQEIVELLPLMIFETDMEGNLTYANKKGLRMYGFTDEDFENGINLFSTIQNKDVERSKENFKEVLLGNRVEDSEFEVIRKDGTVFPIAIYSRPIIKNRKRIGIRAAVVDISKRKEAETSLKKQNNELIERNSELDAFSRTVAHDLQSPISVMLSFANLLQNEYNLFSQEEVMDMLDSIVESANKSQQIIHNLLLFARVRKAEAPSEPLNIKDIVDESLKRLSMMINESNAEIIKQTSWPSVIGFAPWVEEVLVNYISNAVKYGGDNPVIKLGADIFNGNYVRIWVEDNGNGIRDEFKKSVFEKFERLDKHKIQGNGLGLSIVKRIVEKLQGEVGVESEIGKGSLFYFTLPLSSVNEINKR